MKLKFTRNDSYGDFSGDESYYNPGEFDGTEDMDSAEETVSAPSAATTLSPEPPSFAPASVASLKIVNPRGYEDASDIADYLMNGNTVLLNIESMAREQAVRLLDYLAGATHAVGGLMTRVGRTTIVVAPKNVDVSSIEAMVSGN